ncbi:hypothetical protein TrST_g13692 [Triparma strigata]|uniref:WW domain-containing protein n=1 Tax=Triparma strigata TaxID=1606541 RepID=A0A9W7BV88_9STRA|nr:hypothetical protein TrST_g13692 [Triparma strigata]
MDMSTDPRFATLSSVRKALKEAGVDTTTGQSSGEERFQILSARLTAHLYETGELRMDPASKRLERSPPKKREEAVYNPRVDTSLSVVQLKGKLEAMGIDSSTPGMRGQDRHEALLERLSICYDEDDQESSGEESYADSDYSGSSGAVGRAPDWGEGDEDEEDNPSRFYSDFGKAAGASNGKKKKKKKKEAEGDGYVKRQYFPSASGAASNGKDQVAPPRDWASTASYNDDYVTISSGRNYKKFEQEVYEDEEDEEDEEVLHPVEEPLDPNNRYGGFEQYGAQYRKRQFDTSEKGQERNSLERRKQEEEAPPAKNDGQDYIDVISSHFKLSEKKPIVPTPILRPTTRERDRAKRRPTTGERVKFNEPVEPYVPEELRVDDNKPRATLHEHQSNERIRRSQRKKEDKDRDRDRDREKEREKVKTKQQQAQQAKMAKLKAKLGASAPTSPKPKSAGGQRAPFDNLPPPSPGKKDGESGALPRSFPGASDAGARNQEKKRPASRRARKIKKVTGRIKSCKESRVTSIESRLDIRSPMCDPDVKAADKKSSQHEVEVARIKVISGRAKQTLVSSILVDNGKMRLPAQNLLKQLQQRLAAAKKEVTVEQQRVRAEENSSEVHGKQVEASLMEKVRRMEAADAGVGGFSSGESDDGLGEGGDDGGAISPLKMPSAGFPTVQPPPSPLLNLPDAASVEENSPVPQNAFVMPMKRQDIKLPKHNEPQALPPSTTSAPPIHNPGNPIFNAASASRSGATKQPPPKVPKSDRLGLEAVRMQSVDPKRACELHEESLKHKPENINTLNNYALFCHKTLKKMDDAEALFKRGIIVADLVLFDLEEAQEDGDVAEFRQRNRLKITASTTLMSNYANFLKSVRGYASSAETLHKKAINLSPDHAPGLGNYAKFLMDSKHDFVAAEDMFKRALKADPVHSGNLTSYARMLKKMGRFDAAEKAYATAVGVDATNVVLLCNYANFKKKVRGDLEAAKVLYEKGMAMNPDAEYLQKNYKIFLRDYEKSGGKAVPLGGIKKKPSPINKVNKVAEAAAEKAEREKERKRREEVVSSAKKMISRAAEGEGEGVSEGEEEDDEDAEGEGEDAFVMDDKIPAHLLTQKRDPSQMPVEVGVEGWVCYNHPQYGLYYYNEFTNKSTYDKPADFKSNSHAFAKMRSFGGDGDGGDGGEGVEGGDADGGGDDGPDEPADILNSRRSEAEEPIEVINGGWNKFMDDESGWEYWHNEKTGESTYDRPEVYETSNDPFAGAKKDAVGGGEGEHAHKPDVDILSSRRSEAEQPKEVLYDGWVRYVDEESGYEYYVNSVTEESTYDRPKGYETKNDPFGGVRGKKGEEYKPDVDILSSRREEGERPKEFMNGGWARYLDEESGYAYYYNSSTEESTYDRPSLYETKNDPFGGVRGKRGGEEEDKPDVDILSSRRGEGEQPKEVMNGGWARYLDEESGYAYYYNSSTEESTYDRPSLYETKNDPFGGVRGKESKSTKPEASTLSSRRTARDEPVELLTDGWEKYMDAESGHFYYYHEDTDTKARSSLEAAGGGDKETADILSSRRADDAVVEEFLNGGWCKYVDDATGYEYYYNEAEGTSTYDRPDGFQTHQNPFGGVR